LIDLFEIQKCIEQDINCGEFERALNRIIELAGTLANEPIIVGSVFGSRKLDSLCSLVGAKAMELSSIESGARSDDVVAILATELYRTGGHTAVIRDLIAAHRNQKIVLIISDTFHTANHTEIKSIFPSIEIHFAPKSIGSFERVVWLQRKLQELCPRRSFVFNHMDDAVTIAALQCSIPTEVIFYHHCDHKFSLGVFTPCFRHIDFREQGMDNCRRNLGIANNVLLPLVHEYSSTRKNFLSTGSLRTCTSGGYKFEQPYLFSLLEVLPQILRKTGGSHIHIGPISYEYKAAIKARLDASEIDDSKFLQLDYVPNLSEAFDQYRVDLYIDSFPICGCRSVVEAMSVGIPTIVHKNYKSALLSNKNLIYPEAFCWSMPEELYAHLSSVNIQVLLEQSSFAKLFHQSWHTYENLRASLETLALEESTDFRFTRTVYELDEIYEFIELQNTHVQDTARADDADGTNYGSLEEAMHTKLVIDALKKALQTPGENKLGRRAISELLFARCSNASQKRKLAATSPLDNVTGAANNWIRTIDGEANARNAKAYLTKMLFDFATPTP